MLDRFSGVAYISMLDSLSGTVNLYEFIFLSNSGDITLFLTPKSLKYAFEEFDFTIFTAYFITYPVSLVTVTITFVSLSVK